MLQLTALRKRCEHAVVILAFVSSSDLALISDQRYLLVVMQIQ